MPTRAQRERFSGMAGMFPMERDLMKDWKKGPLS
jgi:hypothetical protein